jgi:hypothetical protein
MMLPPMKNPVNSYREFSIRTGAKIDLRQRTKFNQPQALARRFSHLCPARRASACVLLVA